MSTAAALKTVTATPGLIAFWDFHEAPGTPRLARGPGAYALTEMNGPIATAPGGPFAAAAARLNAGQWFNLPRAQCPLLNLHGAQAQVSVVAWIRRGRQPAPAHCEAIAGLWNETRAKRQYCLFLNLHIWDSSDQVCGHVSGVGGPTPGHPWCMDASIGQTPVPFDLWQCVGFTYDGEQVKSYLNGRLDRRAGRNPYHYPQGLFDGAAEGSDFTVGAVHRSNAMGNWFAGDLGGLAVFSRALGETEMERLGVLVG